MKTTKEALKDMKQIIDILEDKGEPFDSGCSEDESVTIIERARRKSPQKPIRIVSDWIWWQIEYPLADLSRLAERHLQPVKIRADQILLDETNTYGGEQTLISTHLVDIRYDCVFESEDITYILCGLGTRKNVTPEQLAFFIGLS
nr:hypothetical protein [uncultured Amphritea sp.]